MDRQHLEFHDNPDFSLLRRLMDAELSAEEFHQLEHRLETDAEFRAAYVRYIDLEASLVEALDEMSPPVAGAIHDAHGVQRVASNQPLALPPRLRNAERAAGHVPRTAGPRSPFRSRVRAWSLVAVCAACLLAGFGYWAGGARPPTGPTLRSHFTESPLRGHKHVAIVTHVEGVTFQAGGPLLRAGARLKPGVLWLSAGQLQLEFLNGAQVVLEGPSELHILAVNSATLISGRAAARVPESARGFVLNAPDAAIVDLGTEFAVAVDDAGHSEVHVIDGEVEVSLLGDDGSTLTSATLYEASSLRVHAEASSLETIEDPVAPLLEIREQPARALPVTDRYYRAVLDSAPFLYWRFDLGEAGSVPNAVGPSWSARRQGTAEDISTIAFENGAARFQQGSGSRFLGPEEALVDFNADSYSIEFWVNPDRLHWATIVAVIPEGDVWSRYHLNVIELAHQTTLVHTPGSFRFLHRHPPNERGGVNLFSQEGCTPGQWHHLVAVKTPAELRLYLNGELTRQIAGAPGNSGNLRYRLVLGQLREDSAERQFAGSLDEFALYRRPLTSDEVRSHYTAMFPRGER